MVERRSAGWREAKAAEDGIFWQNVLIPLNGHCVCVCVCALLSLSTVSGSEAVHHGLGMAMSSSVCVHC